MAVPKKKVSRSKKKHKNSHNKIQKKFISFDPSTGEPKLQHHISLKDGFYNGIKVTNLTKK